MRVAIVGAGLAGLACATRLVADGAAVVLFDKGRGPGGRMATRRLATPAGEAGFDHGAQYFTVRDSGFREEVARWVKAGLAAAWPAAGVDAWVGTPAMNAPLKHLAAGLDVRWNAQATGLGRTEGGWRVEGVDETEFDAVLVAIPAEQAGPLVAPWNAGFAGRATATPAQPCWTVMAAFAERVPGDGILREAGAIGWAARNSDKPGRTGPEAWVIQAGPAWSAAHLELLPDDVLPLLLEAFAARVGGALPSPVAAVAHRWRYARSGSSGEGALWDEALRLGVCGDWLLGPRVECAWISGERLARLVLQAGRKPVATT